MAQPQSVSMAGNKDPNSKPKYLNEPIVGFNEWILLFALGSAPYGYAQSPLYQKVCHPFELP